MAGTPVEEIKARLDLVDVVGSSVPLKRSGSSYKGLCPFHTEKTPSFYVFPETQTWKCFGCQAGGDLFSFVMQRDGVEFGEALQALAARTGVALDRKRDVEREEHDDRLRRANEVAALYFHALLMQGAAGDLARGYVEQRGIGVETRERFMLGYAPDSSTALQMHLLGNGFTREEIVAAGLAVEREEHDADGQPRLRDRFRHRLMFPIRDSSGRTIAFGGRTLAPDGVPKYLNSPATVLFEKGAHLYALDLAREAIRAERLAVIVEGYVDAVMAHQGGFRNVVAALGTALGPRQLVPLGRIADDIVFALDPDAAGQTATLRSLVVAREALAAAVPVPTRSGAVRYHATARSTLRVATLPDGQDPDELIRAAPDRWRELIREAPPVLDFLLAALPARHDLTTAEGKRAAVEEALPALGDVVDPVDRGHYTSRLAALVGIDERAIADLTRPRALRAAGAPPALATAKPDRLEEYALALVALGTPAGALVARDFERPECAALLGWLQAGGAAEGAGEARPPDALTAVWDAVRPLIAENRQQTPAQWRAELDNTALELRKRRLAREEWEIRRLVQDGGAVEARELATRLRDLTVQRAELERAQAARGRVVASSWRLAAVKEVLGDS